MTNEAVSGEQVGHLHLQVTGFAQLADQFVLRRQASTATVAAAGAMEKNLSRITHQVIG